MLLKIRIYRCEVNSITQMLGPQDGELDPTQGMYWTWRSGYINFKCEGNSMSCPGRNHQFQFHIGGFQSPYNTIRNVDLNIHSDTFIIQLDLTPIFTAKRVEEEYNVMSPNANAIIFIDQLFQLFSIQP